MKILCVLGFANSWDSHVHASVLGIIGFLKVGFEMDKEWTGTNVTFLTKFSKTVDQHREMRGPHAHSDQYHIDKLDAAIAPHPQLGAYSSELDMFDTR